VDSGEEIIKQYAELSYMINREEVWPVFKELVDFDMQNQEIQQLLQNKEIQKELGEVVGDLDLLSEEWREKLMEYIQSLSKKDQEELKREAKEALAEIEEQTGEWLRESIYNNIAESVEAFELSKGLGEETLDSDEGIYERERRKVLPLIDKLETDLRDVFVKRRKQGWLSGFKRGKRIDIQKRMQEEARSIPVVDSKSWQRRELPQEMGYAISLLVDLSGSMERDKKIEETFKAVIVLAEVLNRLSIRTEILGFNEDLYVYQRFGQHMNDDIRKQMGKMLTEVLSTKAMHNDDGWAVQEASERLAKQNAEKKFLFVLSDGIPNESRKHPGSEYDLGNIVKEIIKNTDQKVIGLGVGEGTEDMKKYYPNHQVDIKVEQLAEKLANTIREVLVNYDSF
jgi:cobalamin biosynthesis protein CobT